MPPARHSPRPQFRIREERGCIVEISFALQRCVSTPLERRAEEELRGYFDGTRNFFTIPIAFWGRPFSLEVWNVLRRIPRGKRISYSELARRIGRPTAVRAVARTVSRNPLAVVVPCHRVVPLGNAEGRNADVGGYRWGTLWKKRLLMTES